ncbi:hypothetical protein FRC02_004679 [Tulasnella sp. 418]|nr:hypothetical protein FRC02_004679 [Tulasnella sp. 418]
MVFSDCFKQFVVVKIGSTEDLHREELFYERLKAKRVAGIPKFWGSFQEKGDDRTVYIVLEDVSSPISDSHPTMEKWMSVSERDQTIDSLESIHNAGILHGDLRPSNLLEQRGPDGIRTFKIIDFHLAKLVKETHEEHLTPKFVRARKSEIAVVNSILDRWVSRDQKGVNTFERQDAGRPN